MHNDVFFHHITHQTYCYQIIQNIAYHEVIEMSFLAKLMNMNSQVFSK